MARSLPLPPLPPPPLLRPSRVSSGCSDASASDVYPRRQSRWSMTAARMASWLLFFDNVTGRAISKCSLGKIFNYYRLRNDPTPKVYTFQKKPIKQADGARSLLNT